MVRVVLALVILLAIVLVVRNLYTTVRDSELRREKAWDAPIITHGVAVLAAPPQAWAWLAGLAFLALVSNLVLFDSWMSGYGFRETWVNVLISAALSVTALRRLVQLSERVTLTSDRIRAHGWWGESWSMPLSELQGVGETRRTAVLDFGGGKTIEIPDWLEGRFWLARQLRRDVLGARETA